MIKNKRNWLLAKATIKARNLSWSIIWNRVHIFVQSLSFFTRRGKESVITNYHNDSNRSERKKNKGKAEFRKIPKVKFELKDNHVNIPKFKIEFWKEKKKEDVTKSI